MNRRHFLAALALAGCSKPNTPRVVVYCAQDREFAEAVFADYQASRGVEVAARYDTEAAKSVGLAEDIIREKDRPRCGVWWNNEPLLTIRLARLGLLEALPADARDGFPDWACDAEGRYQGFAARARVVVTHTPSLKGPVASIFDLLRPEYRGRAAIAKPLFGTTAAQAACLADVLGLDAAKEYYAGLKANGVAVVAGNKQVAERVAAGRYALGLTDTDDALIEQTQGRPVGVVFPDREPNAKHPRLGTLYLPNTIAVVRGGPNPEASRALARHLLSATVEARLAAGGGYQIPLRAGVESEMPPEIVAPDKGRPMRVDFGRAADHAEAVQSFLRGLFA